MQNDGGCDTKLSQIEQSSTGAFSLVLCLKIEIQRSIKSQLTIARKYSPVMEIERYLVQQWTLNENNRLQFALGTRRKTRSNTRIAMHLNTTVLHKTGMVHARPNRSIRRRRRSNSKQFTVTRLLNRLSNGTQSQVRHAFRTS